MARLRPLRGVRYDTGHVDFGSVLAPPYDVISPAQQADLYSRDLRNVVRIDFGSELPTDVPGKDDRYTRAAGHIESWMKLGILVRDAQPSLYVTDHEFLGADGRRHVRRGIIGCVPAEPWERSEVLPHERTMRGPKADRLALMRATRMQTSAVWVMWDHAPGIAEALAAATGRAPDAAGETPGELDVERLRMWVVSDPAHLAAIDAALAPARLYIADGHHRFETAAAYAAEAGETTTLVYACAADDPVVEVWPTHRLVKPTAVSASTISSAPTNSSSSTPNSSFSAANSSSSTNVLEALAARLGTDWSAQRAEDLTAAAAHARAISTTHHAFGVSTPGGAAVLSTPRAGDTVDPAASLDVSVLADRILAGALGITPDAVVGGALTYTRDVAEAERSVQSGESALAFTVNATSPAEIIAVSDAGEVMPQKSSYFYPKVPTGLLLSPL